MCLLECVAKAFRYCSVMKRAQKCCIVFPHTIVHVHSHKRTHATDTMRVCQLESHFYDPNVRHMYTGEKLIHATQQRSDIVFFFVCTRAHLMARNLKYNLHLLQQQCLCYTVYTLLLRISVHLALLYIVVHPCATATLVFVSRKCGIGNISRNEYAHSTPRTKRTKRTKRQ